jgi:predicted ATP-grasp superfamily ATP-dependent carboligase
MDALVTDAHIRSAVAGLRDLGRAGLRVLAAGPSWTAAGLWSRHASKRALAPDSVTDPGEFADAVYRLAEDNGKPVVYPGHEDGIEAMVGAAERLRRVAVLPFPVGEPLAALRDKTRIGELAERAGLPAAATLAVGAAGEVDPSELALPCVVKPARSRVGLPSAGVARDLVELSALLEAVEPDERVIVQELLDGPLVALAVVVDRGGRLVARFQQRSLATWPRDGGLISLAVSEPPDERLVERVTAMLAELGYFGLVQMDFVATAGGPVLIDANPRFYASQPLALAAGVNLSAAWHAVALGDHVEGPRPYRLGMRFRWLEADLKEAAQGRPRALLTRQTPRPVGAMWDGSDPLPGPLLAASAVAAAARKRLTPRH